MKKITFISLISTLTFSSYVTAGDMGCGGSSACGTAFVALEGGYTTNTINGYNLSITGLNTVITSTKKIQGETVRLSAGMIAAMDEQFAVTGEVGWGYYGRTSMTPTVGGIIVPGTFAISHTLTGFDALVGAVYTQPSYNLFFKAGALIQNMQTSTNANFTAFVFPDVNTLKEEYNNTAVLPEIKLGGAYNFNENWALTAAYMFALGASPKTTGDFNVNTGTSSLSINTQNPTINSLLLGVQYTV